MTEYNKIPTNVNVREVEERPKEVKTRVITKKITTAKPMKRSIFSRIGNALFGKGGVRSIGSYIGKEVVVPAIQNIIVEGITNGVNMMVYGEGHRPGRPVSSGYRPRPVGGSGYVNYADKYNQQPAPSNGNNYITNVRATNRVTDYVIADLGDAKDVLSRLGEQAMTYGVASIADYYDMIGVETAYTDYDYGWVEEDILHTTIKGANGGWYIDFPKIRSIKRA